MCSYGLVWRKCLKREHNPYRICLWNVCDAVRGIWRVRDHNLRVWRIKYNYTGQSVLVTSRWQVLTWGANILIMDCNVVKVLCAAKIRPKQCQRPARPPLCTAEAVYDDDGDCVADAVVTCLLIGHIMPESSRWLDCEISRKPGGWREIKRMDVVRVHNATKKRAFSIQIKRPDRRRNVPIVTSSGLLFSCFYMSNVMCWKQQDDFIIQSHKCLTTMLLCNKCRRWKAIASNCFYKFEVYY